MKKLFLAIALAVVTFAACNKDNNSGTADSGIPDYSKAEYWYKTPETVDPDLCDVFYVSETCVQGPGMQADLSRPEDKAAFEKPLSRAYSIFGGKANFYTPYYRQVTLQVWMGGHETVAEWYPKAYADVKAAFDYYMEHWNGGRPFVLAGFSQGAKGVKELVKDLTEEQYGRMVAAYVMGFSILDEDMAESEHFKAAQGPGDTGVTISYNSVKDEAGISMYFRNSRMIINPVSWSTGTEAAEFTVGGKDYDVRIDPENNVLILNGVDPDPFVPAFEKIFPRGCYHMVEMDLYAASIRENVELRMANAKK